MLLPPRGDEEARSVLGYASVKSANYEMWLCSRTSRWLCLNQRLAQMWVAESGGRAQWLGIVVLVGSGCWFPDQDSRKCRSNWR
jgi:hypothetical protein